MMNIQTLESTQIISQSIQKENNNFNQEFLPILAWKQCIKNSIQYHFILIYIPEIEVFILIQWNFITTIL